MVRHACILKSAFGNPSSRVYWYEVDEDESEKDEGLAVLFYTPKGEEVANRLPISKIEAVPAGMVDWGDSIPRMVRPQKQIV